MKLGRMSRIKSLSLELWQDGGPWVGAADGGGQ